ncbi:MAG TPA: sigma-54 dependent transcriptional regulator [Nitrospira sp.]|nr:sigma-54 dependent transcriptional regulator [Nitrospira sp.]
MRELVILLVDDEPLMRLSMVDALEAVGYEVHAAASGTEGIEAVRRASFDLVITDLRLPGADGLSVLKAAKDKAPETEVVVITAHGSVETAVGAMKFGAFDYMTKPFQMEELLLIVERVGRVVKLRRENRESKETLEDTFCFGAMLSANAQMRAALETVRAASRTDSPILIVGERGTGKELLANAIHQHSLRHDYPLIKVSCGLVPAAALESELFGHEKGAFAGAARRRRGRFELANRGTLFLDEIGAVSRTVQTKLLRVLQERKFERIGGTDTVNIDVRLVCATQKDLKTEVAEGRFLDALYRHLTAVQMAIPPLRQRHEDIMLIAEHVLQSAATAMNKKLKGFSSEARELLLRYSFPGNVQELEDVVKRGATLGRERETVQPPDLCGFHSCPFTGGMPQDTCGFCKEGLSKKGPSGGNERHDAPLTSLAAAREDFEKDYIVSVLERVEGGRPAAAKLLGLSRKALDEKCQRYGISSAKEEPDEES